MESLGNIKKVTETILEVDDEGEALANHEVTLTLHDLDRHTYLLLVRQMRAGRSIGCIINFIEPEMNLDGVDGQVADALKGDESEKQGLAEAMGFKVGEEVVVKADNEKATINSIRSGVSEPIFVCSYQDQENREFRADELAAITPEEDPATDTETPKTPARRGRPRNTNTENTGDDENPPADGNGSQSDSEE